MPPLDRWESFYVIVGSAAAALTGLMFVATALIVEIRGSERQLKAFGTPTVVHFGAALLWSAILSAPWPALWGASAASIVAGVAAAGYVVVAARRQHRQTDYVPVAEDWIFHTVLPLAAYVTIVAASSALPFRPSPSLFVLGGAVLLLLFVGIHNAWDTVTYILLKRWETAGGEKSG